MISGIRNLGVYLPGGGADGCVRQSLIKVESCLSGMGFLVS